MASNSSALIVPPPSSPAAVTNDIRAIKPPVEVSDGLAWLWWTLGVIVLAVLLMLVWRWWRKKRSQPSAVPFVPPHVRARQRLEQAMALISDPRLFCIEVSDTIRWYLEERFEFRAPERTTEEFLAELQATELLTPDQKQSLGDFLQSCDLVKFARYEPPETELRGLYHSALRLIDETQYDPADTLPHTPNDQRSRPPGTGSRPTRQPSHVA